VFRLAEDRSPAVLNRMPQFKGGQEAMVNYIYRQLKVPAAAQKENIQALVQVKFNVDSAGTVSNIAVANTKLKRAVGAGADMDYMDASSFKLQNRTILAQLTEAAAEVVKATSSMWEAGLKNGKPVAAEVTLPVLFTGSGELNLHEQLKTTLLSYQTDAYDIKSIYEANEVDVSPALMNVTLYRFIAENLRYPQTNFKGQVKVFYIVTERGSIIGPVTNAPDEHKAVADEIARVFKLTEGKWTPAKKNTQPVTASQEFTIEFITDRSRKKLSNATAAPADVVITKYK